MWQTTMGAQCQVALGQALYWLLIVSRALGQELPRKPYCLVLRKLGERV